MGVYSGMTVHESGTLFQKIFELINLKFNKDIYLHHWSGDDAPFYDGKLILGWNVGQLGQSIIGTTENTNPNGSNAATWSVAGFATVVSIEGEIGSLSDWARGTFGAGFPYIALYGRSTQICYPARFIVNNSAGTGYLLTGTTAVSADDEYCLYLPYSPEFHGNEPIWFGTYATQIDYIWRALPNLTRSLYQYGSTLRSPEYPYSHQGDNGTFIGVASTGYHYIGDSGTFEADALIGTFYIPIQLYMNWNVFDY